MTVPAAVSSDHVGRASHAGVAIGHNMYYVMYCFRDPELRNDRPWICKKNETGARVRSVRR
jgi:hypothetical protein